MGTALEKCKQDLNGLRKDLKFTNRAVDEMENSLVIYGSQTESDSEHLSPGAFFGLRLFLGICVKRWFELTPRECVRGDTQFAMHFLQDFTHNPTDPTRFVLQISQNVISKLIVQTHKFTLKVASLPGSRKPSHAQRTNNLA